MRSTGRRGRPPPRRSDFGSHPGGFRRWLATTPRPAPAPGPLIDCEAPPAPAPHHFCYGRQRHPELRLVDGKILVTVSQNWDDGVLHPLHDYQPLFLTG